ncbi:MAG: cysteine rich repeat-containing protein [Deltaproteobacteria bacterium]
MKYAMIWTVVICLVLVVAGSVSAQQKLIDSVAKGCDKEIKTYCKDVKQGEGRVLACLYAYGDKLSSQCEYALYDAAAQLEQAIAMLTYLANECRDDLKTFCSSVQPGQGRLLACIDKNKEKISGRCKEAFKDVSGK